jgi:hypothetical protein
MRTIVVTVLAAMVCICVGCASLFKDKITVRDAVAKKNELEQSDNIAKKALITRDLEKKRVEIADALVKDVAPSGNIDYEFSVLVTIALENMTVDCYIYTQDVAAVAALVKGKSRIHAIGDFGRFFTMLDNKNVKMEIINADIEPLAEK